MALADLPQRTTLSLRRAGRIFQRQFGESAGEFIQTLQQDFRLNMRKAARLDIVRRTFEQDVPYRQQWCAVKAPAIVFVVTKTGFLVALRHMHLAFKQQTRGRFFFVLASTDLHRYAEFGNALLQQLADHQRPGGQVHRFFAAFGRMILQLQRHRFRGDRHLVDADDRPLLFTAGDQLRRGVIGPCGLNRQRLELRLCDRRHVENGLRFF